jgi:hypothetical protein
MHRPVPAPRGVATLLFILLTGLSLGALVFGATFYVRGAQSQALTVHAQTQAQLKAWSGVEVLRQYLFLSGAEGAAALQAGQWVTLNGLEGVSARVVSVAANDGNCSNGTRVGFNLVGSSGGANSLLGVVYCASGGGVAAVTDPGGPDVGKPVVINGPLTLSGDLKMIKTNGNEKVTLVVNGPVSGNGSLSGINTLIANGDVTLGGSTSIDNVSSAGSVDLSGSGNYTTVGALKNITLTGGVAAGSLAANGSVSILSNRVTSITAIGSVSATEASIGSVKTQGSMTGTNTGITSSALVRGNYKESNDGSVASGQYGGTLSKQGWNTKIQMTRVPGLVVPITPLTFETIQIPTIDAYAYRSAANYQFDRDRSNRTVVTVSQVNGVPDGTYYLAGNADKQDYLCTGPSYAAANCPAKICVGYSDSNSCFDYSGGTWSINGKAMAPGVVWFKGNLSAGVGTYFNSFIATGNITTAGDNITKAVNYAGPGRATPAAKVEGVCVNSRFGSLYPLNYCTGTGGATFVANPPGNIVFAAGGQVGSTYVGGRIDLTASNDVYGDVLAGDLVVTGGSTTVHGLVLATRQGSNVGNSGFGASTKIDLTSLPTTFDPPNYGPTATAAPASAKLLWSRYQ